MQQERLILIPPTHEQSVYSFHVEESLAPEFLKFLGEKGIEPWRPPVEQEKQGPDHKSVIEIDVDTKAGSAEMESLMHQFLATVPE